MMTSAKAAQMSTMTPGTGSGRRLAVFAAFDSCGFDVYRPELANVTITAAVAAAKAYTSVNVGAVNVGVDVFDSCDAVSAIVTIDNATTNNFHYRAIAGPGVNRLCDFTAYIYQQVGAVYTYCSLCLDLGELAVIFRSSATLFKISSIYFEEVGLHIKDLFFCWVIVHASQSG
jgi:hypothetical protein